MIALAALTFAAVAAGFPLWLVARNAARTDRWDLPPTGQHVAEAVALANGESATDIEAVRYWLRSEVIAEEAHKAARTLDEEWSRMNGASS